MRKAVLLFSIFLLPFLSTGQVKTDEQGSQYFEMQEGDTVYVMKKYFLVFLKSGENRSQNELETEKIQAAHLAHMDSLAAIGQLDIAGPMAEDGEIRGIVVLRVPDKARAEACVLADPAVKAGRLSYEIHPWWAAVGSKLR